MQSALSRVACAAVTGPLLKVKWASHATGMGAPGQTQTRVR